MSSDGLSEDDKALFRQVTKTVKPLKPSQTITTTRQTPLKIGAKKIVLRPRLPPIQPLASPLHLSNYCSEEVTAEAVLSFCRHSIPTKRLRELRQGKIKRDAKLDLHGLRIDDAEQALVGFILQHIEQQHRCLLIVHGKGSYDGAAPILKNRVNHWLRQIPQVLAFHSAEPKEGGTGALYVLLKRNRDSSNGID